jgi:excisionase family DNA binding protein
MKNKLLTVKEASAILNISTPTLYRYISARAIPYLKLGTGAIRFDPDDLENWISQQRVDTAADIKQQALHEIESQK